MGNDQNSRGKQCVDEFEIYTDGSFKKGYGSWAYVVTQKGEALREASGRAKKTDSNRMEFQAVIESLKTLTTGTTVTIFTDSRVLIENVPLFSEWKSQNWVKKNNRPIPNVDLLKNLHELIQQHHVTWQWVKAHSGQKHNERCDELCILARGPLPTRGQQPTLGPQKSEVTS